MRAKMTLTALPLLALVLAACALAAPASDLHHLQRGRQILLHSHLVDTNAEPHVLSPTYRGHLHDWPADTKLEHYISLRDATPVTRRETEQQLGRALSVYVPHNTFLFYGTHEEAQRAQGLEHVHWVGVRNPEHKVAPGLDRVDEDKPLDLLVVLTPEEQRDAKDAARESAALCAHLKSSKVQATCEAGSADAVHVRVASAAQMPAAARAASAFPTVHFVERRPVILPQNDIARQLIEDRTDPSVNPTGNLLTGLFTGEGLTIGLVDSGMDWDNCFFYDENVQVPFDAVDQTHRKIVMYDTEWGNRKDDFLHGTHMAGTMVGLVTDQANWNSSRWNVDRDLYRGLVSDAKVAFVDINADTINYNVPTDMTSMFDKTRNAGAYVSAFGWGVASDYYSNLDVMTDRYTYLHQDYLPLFPVGNQEYQIKLQKPLSPATAKGSVGVGSSFSAYRSFTRKDGITGYEYSDLHRFWYAQLCGEQDSWYYFSPFCTGQGWQFPCNELKDDFCDGLNGFIPFGPAGNATRCCDYAFLNPICCQKTVEEDINDNPGLVYSSLAVDGGSIRGPIGYDGRFGVDVIGPGQFVVSARSDQDTSSHNCGDDAIVVQNGTSMSTAVVAAAALKIQEYFLKGYHPTGTPGNPALFPSARLIKAFLAQSGDFMGVINANSRQKYEDLVDARIPNNYIGFGRVQLDKVLKVPGSTINNLVYDTEYLTNQSSLSVRPVWGSRKCVKLGDGVANVKITLTWSDPPVVAGAGIALRNNLDLSVLTDFQIVYKSNSLFGFDAVNPIEQISFVPLTKTFSILVRGTKMVDAPETIPYSLLVTATGGSIQDVTSTACIGVCPHRCSFRGFCNLKGQCECESGYEGVDCSLSVCPRDCSGNGVCDGLNGTCKCGQFWVGDACDVPLPEGAAEVIVVPGNCSDSGLVEIGVVIAASIGAFFAGVLLGGIAGFVVGVKWLVNRKKKQVAAIRQQMASRDQGRQGAGREPAAP